MYIAVQLLSTFEVTKFITPHSSLPSLLLSLFPPFPSHPLPLTWYIHEGNRNRKNGFQSICTKKCKHMHSCSEYASKTIVCSDAYMLT